MDSDDEFDMPQGRPASNIVERRRTQKLIFESWITSGESMAEDVSTVHDGYIEPSPRGSWTLNSPTLCSH